MNIKETASVWDTEFITPVYASRHLKRPVPKYQLSEESMSPEEAYALVHDHLMLDGNARLNLATFVTTWMEPYARKLISETLDKNLIDKDEYPQTAELESRCVKILAGLFHAPDIMQAIGCSTVGSSEAVMLSGLALLHQWRERRLRANKSIDKPNLVTGINMQICWKKFCRYWDVELREVPMAPGRYILNAEEAIKLCDENTICIAAVLGSTFTGEYEPAEKINDALDALNTSNGWEIPLHIDAASGGFIAPFIQPDLIWDFRLKWVHSINVSGHKYGLVYPGLGWAIWRNITYLPKELIFYVNYLGGEMPTFTLNFSKSGSQVVAQYYNFLRLGREGYAKIQRASQEVAMYTAQEIAKLGIFELLSDGSDIPVFAWKLKQEMSFTLFDLSERLRYSGWQVPAYTLPANLEDTVVMRIVVREGFSREIADLLLNDIKRAINHFEMKGKQQAPDKTVFHHM